MLETQKSRQTPHRFRGRDSGASDWDTWHMRRDANPNQIVQAVVRAIIAKFDRSDWISLALVTDQLDYVKNHPRLLRSLDWGDSDYEGYVIEAVPIILGQRGRGSGATFANLREVEDAVSLKSFLQESDPKLSAALYGGEGDAMMDDLSAASDALGIGDVDVHAARIRRGLHDDPALAIGSAKELLETVLKAILGLKGNGPETNLDLPKLVKRVNEKLGLDAAGVRGEDPGAAQRRQFFGSLSMIVTSTSELRNAGFGTGHGGVDRPELDLPTARLVVSSAVALATFYVEASAAERG